MNRWTDSQLKAIQSRGKDILISAGAGSGKTAVLIERIISLIKDDKVDADKLLIVTFTKTAAAEMRLRIRKALYMQLSDSQNRDFIFEQINKFENSQISTLHSFCLKVVQTYYYIVGLDPGSTLLSDAELEILKNECLDELFEKYYSDDNSDFLKLVDSYSSGSDDVKLREIVLDIYNYSMNRLNPQGWLSKGEELYALSINEIDVNPVTAYLIGRAKAQLTQSLDIINEAFKICSEIESDPKKAEYFHDTQNMLINLINSCKIDLRAFLNALQESKFNRYNFRTLTKYSETLRFMQKLAKEIFTDLKDKYTFRFETYNKQSQKISKDISGIINIVTDFSDLFTQRKSELNSIDYNDLEHKTLLILEDTDAIGEISSSFEYVMIDEYQDTNEIQENIITKIAKKDRLFCVGDLKQSIYRFRDADPEIFIKRYEKCLNESEECELIFLNTNFRTNEKIIDSINFIFDKIFHADTGGVNYSPNERLNASIDCAEKIKSEIRILDLKNIHLDEEDEDKDKADYEGELIASLIEELISSKVMVPDKDTQNLRELRYNDISIISRSLSNTHDSYTLALRKRNIPYSSDYAENFYDEIEISFIVNMLKLIDNEYDDIALLSVMRSYLYEFNADELLKIKLRSDEYLYYHECASYYLKDGDDENIKKKLQKLYDDLKHLRMLNKYISIEELIRAVYSISNIQIFASALPNSEIRKENLAYLLKLASSYEKTTFKGLYHFLKYAEKRREMSAEARRKLNSNSNKDGVKLMTIHKSKGLEFEVVIIANCTKRFNVSDIRSTVLSDKDFGVTSQMINMDNMSISETLMFKASKEKLVEGNTSEELRLLYVAMTRAKNRLYFTGVTRTKNKYLIDRTMKLSKYEIMSASSYYDWISMAISSGQFDSNDELLAENDNWIIREVELQKLIANKSSLTKSNKDETDGSSAELFEKVVENISFEYPNKLSASIPSKMSVTALSSTDSLIVGEKLLEMTKTPKFLSDEHEFTALEKGSIAHKILQTIDLSAFRTTPMETALQEQLKILADRKILTHRELDSLNLDLIISFLNSDLGNLMIAADDLNRESAFIMSMRADEISEEWAGSEEEIIIQGIIDCWFETNEKLYLVDYKTDRFIKLHSSNATFAKYLKQIGLYANALEKIHGKKPDESYICFLSMEKQYLVDV